jgi:hypothetical protein
LSESTGSGLQAGVPTEDPPSDDSIREPVQGHKFGYKKVPTRLANETRAKQGVDTAQGAKRDKSQGEICPAQ